MRDQKETKGAGTLGEEERQRLKTRVCLASLPRPLSPVSFHIWLAGCSPPLQQGKQTGDPLKWIWRGRWSAGVELARFWTSQAEGQETRDLRAAVIETPVGDGPRRTPSWLWQCLEWLRAREDQRGRVESGSEVVMLVDSLGSLVYEVEAGGVDDLNFTDI